MGIQQFDTNEEANQRLGGVVLLYKGHPTYVAEVRGDVGNFRLMTFPLPQPARNLTYTEIALNDPDLSTLFNGLGFVNEAKHNLAFYVSRLPTRGRYKQGLYDHNLHIQAVGPNDQGGLGLPGHNFTSIIKTGGFVDMITNKYPPIPEAVERVLSSVMKTNVDGYKNPTVYSVAVDRTLALTKDDFRGDVMLHYKTERVAFGPGNVFTVVPGYKHLREFLDEKGIKLT